MQLKSCTLRRKWRWKRERESREVSTFSNFLFQLTQVTASWAKRKRNADQLSPCTIDERERERERGRESTSKKKEESKKEKRKREKAQFTFFHQSFVFVHICFHSFVEDQSGEAEQEEEEEGEDEAGKMSCCRWQENKEVKRDESDSIELVRKIVMVTVIRCI